MLVIDLPHGSCRDADTELPVSRIALRRTLSKGLDNVVHYGKKLIAFEDAPEGVVTAHFEDGTCTSGDVLVGADGASSRLREQLLPYARRVETCRPLIQTLATYERDMIGYGFAAVQTSLKDMKRFHAKGLLAGTVAKSFFRLIDHIAPLKAMFLDR